MEILSSESRALAERGRQSLALVPGHRQEDGGRCSSPRTGLVAHVGSIVGADTADRQRVSLRVKHPLVQRQEATITEQQVQVLRAEQNRAVRTGYCH